MEYIYCVELFPRTYAVTKCSFWESDQVVDINFETSSHVESVALMSRKM